MSKTTMMWTHPASACQLCARAHRTAPRAGLRCEIAFEPGCPNPLASNFQRIPRDIVFVEHVGPCESRDICVRLLVARILVKRAGREHFRLFQPKIFRFRFFFPWPYQPHQCFCTNTERVALQRRLPADDQWATRLCCCRAFLIVCHAYIIRAHILPFTVSVQSCCASCMHLSPLFVSGGPAQYLPRHVQPGVRERVGFRSGAL